MKFKRYFLLRLRASRLLVLLITMELLRNGGKRDVCHDRTPCATYWICCELLLQHSQITEYPPERKPAMSTKKTALTMTDSERCFVESHDLDLPDDFPKTLKDENYMLKIVVEEQKIALDMIMRKYREQTDRLTRLSQIDLRKLHYQRYLHVIVNQLNKMDNMTKTMRRNLLVIFKYEELMRDLEAENGRLRELVKSLSAASIKSKKEMKQCLEVSCQTDKSSGITMENKSVGSESPISRKVPQKLINEPSRISCTEVVPYVPINYDFGDAGLPLTKEPTTADLPYNEASEVFFSRFAAASISEGISSSCEGTTEPDAMSPNTHAASDSLFDLEQFEDPSEACVIPDFEGEETNLNTLVNDGKVSLNSSKKTITEEIYDDVQ